MIFGKKHIETKSYDPTIQKPVLKCSICTGEQVAGFKDLKTGKIEEITLIRNEKELQKFRDTYQITEPIEKVY